MGNGWIALHRSLLDHWLWKDKPFSNGQAWTDLILLANHKDVKEYGNGTLKTFRKGTVNRSIEYMSNRWGWNRKKTRRFLNALEVDGMVTVNVTTHGTTITIVNYDIYQTVGKTNGTTIDQTEGQPRENNVPQTTMNNNDNNDKQEREEPELAPIKTFRFKTGRWENVLLSNEEAAKLTKEFGEAEARKMIDKLSDELATKENRYRQDGHYALICKWLREDKDKPQYKPKQKQADAENRTYSDADYLAMERKKLGIGGQNG